ncbi:BatD family protein, partial [uncultured Cetobacterium sp.]
MKKYNALFLFLLIANSIFADVILNTSNANPSLYDIITLQAIFRNEDKDGYKIDGLNNFDVLGKGSNSSYSMINGKVTSEKSDTYRIKAKKTGVFTLTLISKKGNSKSINIDVSNNQNQKEIINNKFSLQVNKLKKDYYFGEKIPFE